MGTDPALVAHLYRRAGFGATPAAVDSLSDQNWDELVSGLISGLRDPGPAGNAVELPHLTSIPQSNVPGYRFNGWDEYTNLIGWWLQRMLVTSTPLREKLTWLLHCQFPTSFSKVGWAYMMYVQNQIFRTLGPGNFETLVQAVAKDPAMLLWLDTATSHKDAPNQNFARELMERFTMGVGNYSQEDVIQAARCFTGWELDGQSGEFYFNPYDNDDGVKTFLGHIGRFSGEDIIRIVTHHPASHSWVVSRLWSWLGYPVSTNDPVVGDLVAGYAKDLNVTNLLEAMFHHPAFVSPAALYGLVKQPVEVLVGALRTLGLNTAPFQAGDLAWMLGNIGQVPFTPPSVGGWGSNEYWQSTGAAAGYIGLAAAVAQVADLTAIENSDGHPADQVTAVLGLVGLPQVSARTHAAITSLALSLRTSNGSWPAQQMVTLALVAPE
ncbi:MAG TPA: DUF1800 domain-containing protein, partial [Acidimicrobiales bacterium]|nr:DUF1800 domain-containing protein [Acidimicrobiales bacterium]